MRAVDDEGNMNRGAVEAPGGATAPVEAGQILVGKYRVEEVIGVGGMGVVVAASHIHCAQRVAIKFLLPHAVSDENAVARFAREGRALARLRSEHAARVFDVGTLVTGEPFLVLECLSGQTLAAILAARRQLEIGEAVLYVHDACVAMAEAHALGITHRDIKPENLFLTTRDDGAPIVKVIDFGISKIAPESEAFSPSDSGLTTTTAVVGSPLYMSPEQLRAARNVDARSDIWSLGITLYELLTGEGPFPWKTIPELSAANLKAPPRALAQVRPDVPASLAAVVMRCLEKNPDDRPATALDLARALAPFASERSRAAEKARSLDAMRTWSSALERFEEEEEEKTQLMPSTAGWLARVSSEPAPVSSEMPSVAAPLEEERSAWKRGVKSALAALSLVAVGAMFMIAGVRGRALPSTDDAAAVPGAAAVPAPTAKSAPTAEVASAGQLGLSPEARRLQDTPAPSAVAPAPRSGARSAPSAAAVSSATPHHLRTSQPKGSSGDVKPVVKSPGPRRYPERAFRHRK